MEKKPYGCMSNEVQAEGGKNVAQQRGGGSMSLGGL